jgi:hypothetical protein
LGIDVVKAKWSAKQGDRDNETFLDQWQTASVELGIKETVGFGSGPLRAEAKLGLAGFIEVDRSGVRDIGAKLAAEAKLTSNLIKHQEGTASPDKQNYSDPKINATDPKGFDLTLGPVKDQGLSIGSEARISLQTGFQVQGKGILSGLKSR